MRILILGHSRSGKTTAAEMVADMIGSPSPKNCSDFIIQHYADSVGKSAKKIKANKNAHRQELFKYGLMRQSKDPAYPVKEALKKTNVVTGVRTTENLNACKDLFDIVMWIDRQKIGKDSTDQLGPEDVDVIIDNNGSLKELEYNLRMAIIKEMA